MNRGFFFEGYVYSLPLDEHGQPSELGLYSDWERADALFTRGVQPKRVMERLIRKLVRNGELLPNSTYLIRAECFEVDDAGDSWHNIARDREIVLQTCLGYM